MISVDGAVVYEFEPRWSNLPYYGDRCFAAHLGESSLAAETVEVPHTASSATVRVQREKASTEQEKFGIQDFRLYVDLPVDADAHRSGAP